MNKENITDSLSYI